MRNIDWPEAVLFDCDGVLAETERDGHRQAFNEAFKLKGLGQHEWSVEEYGRLLEIGGGKERMNGYFLVLRGGSGPHMSLGCRTLTRILPCALFCTLMFVFAHA